MDISDKLYARLLEVQALAEAVTVQRVALTQALIVAHRLPARPPKEGDKRTPGFVERYGAECVEVDALPPDVLVDIVERAHEPQRGACRTTTGDSVGIPLRHRLCESHGQIGGGRAPH
jgi:hypothetical protein